jgi:predicted nucleic acid-binding protein
MITVYELLCGVEKAQDPAKERQKVERFISAVIELPLDRAAAETAARIRADLERQGQPIGPYDLLIPGQALQPDAGDEQRLGIPASPRTETGIVAVSKRRFISQRV